MKRIPAYFFTLFVLLISYSAGAHGEPVTKKTKKEVIQIASSLLAAIDSYKHDQRSKCITELTQRLSFELVKDVTHEVPKNAEVDSLVVGNDQLFRWGYFKTVDLDYLKDVEAVITMQTEQSEEIARALTEMLNSKGLDLTQMSGTVYEFRDQQGGYVIDDRFRVPTRSYIDSRYHYKIEVMDDYLMLDIREVVSTNWISESKKKDKPSLAKN